MTGQHVANQWKLIFSEYGWPETLISNNGQCYTVEAFTSVMNAYHVNHITSSNPLSAVQWTCWKVCTDCEESILQGKNKRVKTFKCLMIYHNTPLSGSLQTPMQILQSRSTRPDLPMSNVARQQFGLQSEKLRNVNKNEHMPSHDLHIGQEVMYQDATSKQWYPATITSLCVQPRSYNITTREGVTCRKT